MAYLIVDKLTYRLTGHPIAGHLYKPLPTNPKPPNIASCSVFIIKRLLINKIFELKKNCLNLSY